MTTVRLIPCLDIKNGRVVKGTNFVNIRDAGDPVQLAKFYNSQGADELVFLDITASSDSRAPVIDLAEQVAAEVFIPFTVGGGIRTTEAIQAALHAGADKVSLNTAAVQNPDLIQRAAERFGAQCIVTAIDARKSSERDGWDVFIHGGRTPTGIDVVEWAVEAVRRGSGEILLTSMDGDGTQAGYDLGITRAVSTAVDVPVIASGGAGNAAHLVDAVEIGRADAVLLASIIHDCVYSIGDLKWELHEKGIPVRLTGW